MNIAAGDPVELFAYDGRRLPDAKAVKIEKSGKITDAEKAFVQKQRMDEGLRTRWNADAYAVTLDRTVELPMGSLVASARRMGNGFLVQGCDFGFNRSRGILIKASDGKVLNNKITESWMMAVLVSPEYWWLESGSSNNVEIRGNVITGCKGRPIYVHAQGGEGLITGKAAPAGAHNNITILGNTMTDCLLPGIEVTSTEGLRVENNTVVSPRGARPQDAVVKTVNCEKVTQQNNVVK
jgi:parallel beta-helix repeat protein